MALRTLSNAVARSGLSCRSHLALLNASDSFTLSSVSRFFASVPEDLKFNDSHEWVRMDGDIATVGISDFAQAELGDIVYVELPEVGSEVVQGENFGVVESVKAASDVYAPVTGEVSEVNSALVDEASLVNDNPFEDGWMMKVKVTDKSQLDKLLDSKAYAQHCESKGDDH